MSSTRASASRSILASVLSAVALGLAGCNGGNPGNAASSGSSTSSPVTTEAPAAAVPAQYQPIYDALEAQVESYDRQIAAAWDGKQYAVNYAGELISANGNGGFGILQDTVKAVMMQEIQAEHDMGFKAITIQVGFPIFEPALYESLGQSPAQAQQTAQTWLDYYTSVVQTIHSLGMKVIVEANPMLTLFNAGPGMIDATAYYRSLDLSTYQKLRSDHNIIVAQKLKPDYLLLQTEPETDAVNARNPALTRAMNDPAADTAMVRYWVEQLDAANVPGLHSSIKLGSGAGSWQTDWREFATALAAIPGLDEIDTHIYNLQGGPDEVGVAMKIADIAHAAGKGASISEFWLHKSTLLLGFATNGDSLEDVRARDSFSFWAPLDRQFLAMMVKLANYKHFDYISAFGHYYWFNLVDYASLTQPCPPVYPAADANQNAACDSQVQMLQNNGAKAGLAAHILTPTGEAYKGYIAALPPK
jgi:hypothetical protein